MKRGWTEEELVERWTLAPDELPLLANKGGANRLGFAVLLRFFAGEGRFPRSKGEVPGRVVSYLGEQVGVPAEGYLRYSWRGRSVKYHRAEVREHFGFREATSRDADELARWLLEEVLPHERDPERLREAVQRRCREGKFEPPSPGRVERLITSATRAHHERFCEAVHARLSPETLRLVEALLETGGSEESEKEGTGDARRSELSETSPRCLGSVAFLVKVVRKRPRRLDK